MAMGAASPDDPALADYRAWRRRRKMPLPTNKTTHGHGPALHNAYQPSGLA